MVNKPIFAVAVAAVLAAGSAHAQGRHAVSTLPIPYACVRLNVEPGLMHDHPDLQVPVYAEPSAEALVIGQALDVMVARWPQQPRNGFFEVVRTQNVNGWVPAKYLRAWTNPYAPSARCEAVIMSDGSVGTRTVR